MLSLWRLLVSLSRLPARRRVQAWQAGVVTTLVTEVFPKSPYQYDAALSFLQEKLDPKDPVRLTLFFPDYPLAIDLIGPDLAPDYREARPYQEEEQWREALARLAWKRSRLDRYRCPYLLLRSTEPLDPVNLRERVRSLLGRYPK